MASSADEISRQVQDSARIAGEAVEQAQKANDRVGELGPGGLASTLDEPASPD